MRLHTQFTVREKSDIFYVEWDTYVFIIIDIDELTSRQRQAKMNVRHDYDSRHKIVDVSHFPGEGGGGVGFLGADQCSHLLHLLLVHWIQRHACYRSNAPVVECSCDCDCDVNTWKLLPPYRVLLHDDDENDENNLNGMLCRRDWLRCVKSQRSEWKWTQMKAADRQGCEAVSFTCTTSRLKIE